VEYIDSFLLFESNDDFISNLTNFCEENLVYLIDYGLRVKVEKLRDYYSFSDSFRQQNNLATHYNGGYQFKLENYKNPTIIRLDMFNIGNSCWSEIKDSIVPFLIRLKSEYNISQFIHSNKKDEIEFITNSHSSLYYNLDDVINNKDLAPGFTFDYFSIETIFIIVDGYKDSSVEVKPKGKMQRFIKRFFRYNEALTADQQLAALQDLCDAHFAYLYDDGYKVSVDEFSTAAGDVTQIVIRPPKIMRKSNRVLKEEEVGTPFADFKDRLIPFVYMLLKDYRLLTNEEMKIAYLVSMGFASPNIPYPVLHRLDSLDDLEQIEDDLRVLAFYIRVKKKD